MKTPSIGEAYAVLNGRGEVIEIFLEWPDAEFAAAENNDMFPDMGTFVVQRVALVAGE